MLLKVEIKIASLSGRQFGELGVGEVDREISGSHSPF